MTEEHQLRSVGTLAELVDVVELAGVTVYEQSGKRHETAVAPDGEPNPAIEAFVRGYDGGIETRFTMTYEGPGYVIVSDLALRYEDREEYRLEPSVVPDFLEVAIMAAYPYLREGVTTSAARLGVDRPVLGMVRRGDIQFGRAKGPSPSVAPTADQLDRAP